MILIIGSLSRNNELMRISNDLDFTLKLKGWPLGVFCFYSDSLTFLPTLA